MGSFFGSGSMMIFAISFSFSCCFNPQQVEYFLNHGYLYYVFFIIFCNVKFFVVKFLLICKKFKQTGQEQFLFGVELL